MTDAELAKDRAATGSDVQRKPCPLCGKECPHIDLGWVVAIGCDCVKDPMILQTEGQR